MKIFAAAISTLLVTSALSACALEEEALNEVVLDESAEPARAPSEEVVLDGRAAAAEEARKNGGSIGALGLASSWFSGTIAPGVTQHWNWNNAGTGAVFEVGLSPIGASTSASCRFQVTRQWYVQKHGGEREFRWDIKNIGTIACGANVYLGYKVSTSTVAVGGLAPGGTSTRTWNNANPTSSAYMIGVDPQGATSADPCQMEITRQWYALMPDGERELRYVVKNVGDIACQANVLLARATANVSSWDIGPLAVNASDNTGWNNANPLSRIYVPAFRSIGVGFGAACQLEVTSSHYRQVINSTGAAEREYLATVKNVGTVGCSGEFLLNYVD